MKMLSTSSWLLIIAFCLSSPLAHADSKKDRKRDRDKHHDDRERDHKKHRDDRKHDRDRHQENHSRHSPHHNYCPPSYTYYQPVTRRYSRPVYYNTLPSTTISLGFGTGYHTNHYSGNSDTFYREQQAESRRDVSLEIAVQRKLARLGYYDGEFDGDIGPETRRAIYLYQRDNDLDTTGLIDRELIDELGLS